jgi:hypothetical protein
MGSSTVKKEAIEPPGTSQEHPMNPITTNPDAAITIAHRIIDDRIHDAQQRAQARTVRAERRTARSRQFRRAGRTPARHTPFPLAVLRLFRPAGGTN